MGFQTKHWPQDILQQILAQCKEQHLSYRALKIYEENISATETKISVIIPTKQDPSLCHIYCCVVPIEKALETTVELRTCINILNKNDSVVITRHQLMELCAKIVSKASREIGSSELLNLIDYVWQEAQNTPHADWVNTLEHNTQYSTLIYKLCFDTYKLGLSEKKPLTDETKLVITEMIRGLFNKLRELNGRKLDVS